MRRLLIILGCLAVGGALMPAGSAAGQTVTLQKVVDNFDPLPDDPNSTFNIPGGSGGAPAVDGDTIVLKVNPSFTGNQLLWAGSLSAGTFVRLADQNTAIPNGDGLFIDYQPYMANSGSVVFRGNGGPSNQESGLYVVPAQGGAITMLVNQDTPIPEGTGSFGAAGSFPVFKVDGTDVIFAGRAQAGIYDVDTAGDPPGSVDHNTFICELGYTFGGVGTFRAPSESGGTVASLVTNVVGEEAIYTMPLAGLIGIIDPCAGQQLRALNATLVASLNVPVPGDPQGRNFEQHSFGFPLIDAANIIFGGAAGPDLSGIYGFTAGGLVNLVDTNTPVPGGTGTFQSFTFLQDSGTAYTLSAGNVVFRGVDQSGTEGIYVVPAAGGNVTKIVAVGDTLSDGRTVIGNGGGFFQPPIQNNSLSGNELAVRIDFSDPALGTTGNGIYLAVMQ